jgi:hypothetical protein
MADVYLGLATPEINWTVWLFVSVFQNVLLTAKLANVGNWVRRRIEKLKQAGVSDNAESMDVDDMMIDASINEYILDVISKVYRAIFFSFTMPLLYHGPNAAWFPFTVAYSQKFYGKDKAGFTFEPSQLNSAIMLSGISLIPIIINTSWAFWYIKTRLNRDMTFYFLKISWYFNSSLHSIAG